MSNIKINYETPETIAFHYAAVREQRQAIETAIRVLNETAKQATRAEIKAGDHFMAIRNLLDDKDSQLQEIEYELYSKIKR